jgi:methylated-DNA-[protein]-cysteine S-methyltransferase
VSRSVAAALDSPLGPVFVEGQGSIQRIGFGPPRAPVVPGAFPRAVDQLSRYFLGDLRSFELDLDPRGTPFQLRVWRALTEIPYGETRTYGQLAEELGTVARAVGSANGANPLAIVLPCHRVIGADGTLTGYAGGLDRKEWLLELEGAWPPRRAQTTLF